jgi:hypothetical protein
MGRSAASSITNMYANQVNYNSDSLASEPKRTHLASLHRAIAAVAPLLLASPAALNASAPCLWFNNASGTYEPGSNQAVFVYGGPAGWVAFAENAASVYVASLCPVPGGNASLDLAPYSSQIVTGPTAGRTSSGAGFTVLFDTAAVPPPPLLRSYTALSNASLDWGTWADTGLGAPGAVPPPPAPARVPWSAGSTAVGTLVRGPAPLEQLSLTEDDTEYLVYAARVTLPSPLPPSGLLQLSVASNCAQAFTVLLNGVAVGSTFNAFHTYGPQQLNASLNVTAAAGVGAVAGATVTLTLLSESLGIDNGAGVYGGVPDGVKGVTSPAPGSITLGGQDITTPVGGWNMTVGLAGEALAVFTPTGAVNVSWTPSGGGNNAPARLAGVWYRANFTVPDAVLAQLSSAGLPPGAEVTASLNVDITGFGRGHLYLNGIDLGRYWSILGANTALMSQRYYYLPPDGLLAGPGANTLVMCEVEGAPAPAALRIALSQLTPAPAAAV